MICNKLKGFYSVRNNTFAQINSKLKQWKSSYWAYQMGK